MSKQNPTSPPTNSGSGSVSDMGAYDLGAVTQSLRQYRRQWRVAQDHDSAYGAHGFPSRLKLGAIIDNLAAALFPMRLGPRHLTQETEDAFVLQSLSRALDDLAEQIRMELHAGRAAHEAEICAEARRIVGALAQSLPDIRRLLDTDLEAAFAGDPAARSVDEVLLCYPSLAALIPHRIAHVLYNQGAPLVARIITEIAHSHTGIDIHPGAQIGESFFIDHGTGVVIGQTAIIGRHVRLYQAVTLGARSFTVDPQGHLVNTPRHPVLEDRVTVYAGATILGRVTIGAGSVIGGNVWLTQSVPAGSQVRQGKPSVSIESDALADWPMG
ncbi:serine acetyltransferase [Novosphingobium umbonatum]|uniref:serine O-acetyltransferase n=2 Tax=Novosphingobium umbonatum TaxID=1908524 RepID=A0A3S3TL29_9SPHN|nr:serine acetyltransferase [Novosphingobium umbonatum]